MMAGDTNQVAPWDMKWSPAAEEAPPWERSWGSPATGVVGAGAAPDRRGEFAKGAASGVKQMEGMAYGLIGLLGDSVGHEGLASWGLENYQQKEKEAQANAPRVGSIRDVQGAGDFFDYTAGVLGQTAPFSLTTLGGGGLGGLLASALGKRAILKGLGEKATKEAVERVLKDQAKRAALTEMVKRGALTGSFAASAGAQQGDLWGQLKDAGVEDAVLPAWIFGAAQGALDVAPEKLLADLFFPTHKVTQELTKSIERGLSAGLKRAGKVAATQTLAEGTTEGAQEALSVIARAVSDDKYDWKDAPERIIDNVVAGGIAGLFLGGGAGGLSELMGRREEERKNAPKPKPEVAGEALAPQPGDSAGLGAVGAAAEPGRAGPPADSGPAPGPVAPAAVATPAAAVQPEASPASAEAAAPPAQPVATGATPSTVELPVPSPRAGLQVAAALQQSGITVTARGNNLIVPAQHAEVVKQALAQLSQPAQQAAPRAEPVAIPVPTPRVGLQISQALQQSGITAVTRGTNLLVPPEHAEVVRQAVAQMTQQAAQEQAQLPEQAAPTPAAEAVSNPNEQPPAHDPYGLFATDYTALLDRVLAAEKNSDREPITPEQQALLDAGDYDAFSRARGYTEQQISDHNELVRLQGYTDGPDMVTDYPRGSPNEGSQAQINHAETVYRAMRSAGVAAHVRPLSERGASASAPAPAPTTGPQVTALPYTGLKVAEFRKWLATNPDFLGDIAAADSSEERTRLEAERLFFLEWLDGEHGPKPSSYIRNAAEAYLVAAQKARDANDRLDFTIDNVTSDDIPAAMLSLSEEEAGTAHAVLSEVARWLGLKSAGFQRVVDALATRLPVIKHLQQRLAAGDSVTSLAEMTIEAVLGRKVADRYLRFAQTPMEVSEEPGVPDVTDTNSEIDTRDPSRFRVFGQDMQVEGLRAVLSPQERAKGHALEQHPKPWETLVPAAKLASKLSLVDPEVVYSAVYLTELEARLRGMEMPKNGAGYYVVGTPRVDAEMRYSKLYGTALSDTQAAIAAVRRAKRRYHDVYSERMKKHPLYAYGLEMVVDGEPTMLAVRDLVDLGLFLDPMLRQSLNTDRSTALFYALMTGLNALNLAGVEAQGGNRFPKIPANLVLEHKKGHRAVTLAKHLADAMYTREEIRGAYDAAVKELLAKHPGATYEQQAAAGERGKAKFFAKEHKTRFAKAVAQAQRLIDAGVATGGRARAAAAAHLSTEESRAQREAELGLDPRMDREQLTGGEERDTLGDQLNTTDIDTVDRQAARAANPEMAAPAGAREQLVPSDERRLNPAQASERVVGFGGRLGSTLGTVPAGRNSGVMSQQIDSLLTDAPPPVETRELSEGGARVVLPAHEVERRLTTAGLGTPFNQGAKPLTEPSVIDPETGATLNPVPEPAPSQPAGPTIPPSSGPRAPAIDPRYALADGVAVAFKDSAQGAVIKRIAAEIKRILRIERNVLVADNAQDAIELARAHGGDPNHVMLHSEGVRSGRWIRTGNVHVILMNSSTSKAQFLKSFAHEMGHAFFFEHWGAANTEMRRQVKAEYSRFMQSEVGKRRQAERARHGQKYTLDEYMADQVAAFVHTDKAAATAVGRWYKQLATYLGEVYNFLKQYNFHLYETAEQFIRSVVAPEAPAVEDASSVDPVNVYYGSNQNAELSNLALRPFTALGQKFYSVEHAYQSLKSGQLDQQVYNNPRWARGGVKIPGRQTNTTDGFNIKLMEGLVRASFEQNPAAAERLLATGNAPITHTQDRGIWRTEFPRILMKIRAELAGAVDELITYTRMDQADDVAIRLPALRWSKRNAGELLTEYETRDICLGTAKATRDALLAAGYPASYVPLSARSPLGPFSISHYAAVALIDGKRYLVDMPQTEMMRATRLGERASWTPVQVYFDTLGLSSMLPTESVFYKTEARNSYEGTEPFSGADAKHFTGRGAESYVTERKPLGNDKFEGKLRGAEYATVRWEESTDSETGAVYVENVDVLNPRATMPEVITPTFEPRLIPLEPKALVAAYGGTEGSHAAMILWAENEPLASPSGNSSRLDPAFDGLGAANDTAFETGDDFTVEGSARDAWAKVRALRARNKTVDSFLATGTEALKALNDALFARVFKRVERMNIPAFNKIMRQFYNVVGDTSVVDKTAGAATFFSDMDGWTGRFGGALRDALKGMSELDKTNLMNFLLREEDISKTHPMYERVDAVRKTLSEIRDYMLKAGLAIRNVPYYLPHVYDLDAVNDPNAAEEIRSAAERAGVVNPVSTKPYTLKEITDLLAGMRDGSTSVNTDPTADPIAAGDLGAPWAQAMLHRSLDDALRKVIAGIPGEDGKPKYMTKSLDYLLSTYVRQSILRAEYNRRFGDPEYYTRTQQWEALDDEAKAKGEKPKFDPHLKLKRAFAEAVGEGADQDQVRFMHEVMAAMLGQYGRIESPALRKVMNSTMLFQNMRTLVFTVFSSFPDLANIFIRTGDFKNTWAVMKKNAKAAWRGELNDILRAYGHAADALDSTLMQDVIAARDSDGSIWKINEAFFRAIGLHKWTNFTRALGAKVAEDYITRHAEQAAAGDADSVRRLAELGLTADHVAEWHANGKASYFTNPLAGEGSRRVTAAMQQMINDMVIHPTPPEKTLWGNSEVFKLVWHLKSFMYGFSTRVLGRAFHELKTNGITSRQGLETVAALSLLLPLAAFGLFMRDLTQYWVWGAKSYTPYDDPFKYLWQLAGRSGVTGFGQMAVDTLQASSKGRAPLLALAGPTVTQLNDFLEYPLYKTVPGSIPIISSIPGIRDEIRDALK